MMLLVSPDVKPERQVYCLGAALLAIMRRTGPAVPPLDLYDEFTRQTGTGPNMFFLTLDWLYLLGVIDDEGRMAVDVPATPADHQER